MRQIWLVAGAVALVLIGGAGTWFFVARQAMHHMDADITVANIALEGCTPPTHLRHPAMKVRWFVREPEFRMQGLQFGALQARLWEGEPKFSTEMAAWYPDSFTVRSVMTSPEHGQGFARFLGGHAPAAMPDVAAWRVESPDRFSMVSASGRYDVELSGGRFALLVLPNGEAGTTPDIRPVRVQLPEEITVRVTHDNQTVTREFHFPSMASDWLAHPICQNGELTQLQSFIESMGHN